jgi:hypothetical protein
MRSDHVRSPARLLRTIFTLSVPRVSLQHPFDRRSNSQHPYREKCTADQPDGSRIGDAPSQPRWRSRLSSGRIRELISDPTEIRCEPQSESRNDQADNNAAPHS